METNERHVKTCRHTDETQRKVYTRCRIVELAGRAQNTPLRNYDTEPEGADETTRKKTVAPPRGPTLRFTSTNTI